MKSSFGPAGKVEARSAATHSRKQRMTIGAMRGQPGTILTRAGIPSSHPLSVMAQINSTAHAPMRDSKVKNVPWRIMAPPALLRR
jgi:hypothetical protein